MIHLQSVISIYSWFLDSILILQQSGLGIVELELDSLCFCGSFHSCSLEFRGDLIGIPVVRVVASWSHIQLLIVRNSGHVLSFIHDEVDKINVLEPCRTNMDYWLSVIPAGRKRENLVEGSNILGMGSVDQENWGGIDVLRQQIDQTRAFGDGGYVVVLFHVGGISVFFVDVEWVNIVQI